jgi:hypothetical protein
MRCQAWSRDTPVGRASNGKRRNSCGDDLLRPGAAGDHRVSGLLTCSTDLGRRLDSGRTGLREELTIAQMDRHSSDLEEMDVEGVLAFAERVLPRAADLWVQASLEQRQRFQQLFFPEGISFDGNGFVGTAITAPAFSYLRTIEDGNERMVAQIFRTWNPLTSWMSKSRIFGRPPELPLLLSRHAHNKMRHAERRRRGPSA